MEANIIYQKVQEHYGAAAKGSDNEQCSLIAQAFGYTVDDLASIPKDANLGLSCGNPLILAKLREVNCNMHSHTSQLHVKMLTKGFRARLSSI